MTSLITNVPSGFKPGDPNRVEQWQRRFDLLRFHASTSALYVESNIPRRRTWLRRSA